MVSLRYLKPNVAKWSRAQNPFPRKINTKQSAVISDLGANVLTGSPRASVFKEKQTNITELIGATFKRKTHPWTIAVFLISA